MYVACMVSLFAVAGCSSDDDDDSPIVDGDSTSVGGDPAEEVSGGDSTAIAGGVFAMSNNLEANTIVSYQRASDGTLTLAGEFATGGQGGDFDGGEGLDPLISAYALINTPDNEYLMAVNAGSGSVSVMSINAVDHGFYF